jgi:hypothetical protein
LTSDVVGLIRHDGGDTTIATGTNQEDAKEADTSAFSPSL